MASTYYTYLTEQGVIVPDTSAILAEVQDEWKALFGDDLDVDPSTPQGMMIAAEVIARTNTIRSNADLANQINPNLAGGGFLDSIMALTGLERTKASPTVVTGVALTGVPGATIQAGKRAKTIAGDLFKIVTGVQLDGSGNGTGVFQSVENGQIACDANQLTTIVDNVIGWETVNNPTAGVLGQSTQSDAAARGLRKQTLAKQGRATVLAVMANVRMVSGVKSLQFRENIEPTTEVIDGITMVAHSVWACVQGGADDDIGFALLDAKTLGAAWNGTTTVAVTEPSSGQSYSVKFQRPTEIATYYRATVKKVTPVTNPTESVTDAILAWADNLIENIEGLLVGQSVSPFEVAAAISQQVSGLYVQKMEVSYDGITYITTELAIAIDEVGVTDSDKIGVVIV